VREPRQAVASLDPLVERKGHQITVAEEDRVVLAVEQAGEPVPK
jgi:hypothetical protein